MGSDRRTARSRAQSPGYVTRHHPLATLRHALQVNPAETLHAE
jgi:hypothetical protein